jgi:hypothetical protein
MFNAASEIPGALYDPREDLLAFTKYDLPALQAILAERLPNFAVQTNC